MLASAALLNWRKFDKERMQMVKIEKPRVGMAGPCVVRSNNFVGLSSNTTLPLFVPETVRFEFMNRESFPLRNYILIDDMGHERSTQVIIKSGELDQQGRGYSINTIGQVTLPIGIWFDLVLAPRTTICVEIEYTWGNAINTPQVEWRYPGDNDPDNVAFVINTIGEPSVRNIR